MPDIQIPMKIVREYRLNDNLHDDKTTSFMRNSVQEYYIINQRERRHPLRYKCEKLRWILGSIKAINGIALCRSG